MNLRSYCSNKLTLKELLYFYKQGERDFSHLDLSEKNLSLTDLLRIEKTVGDVNISGNKLFPFNINLNININELNNCDFSYSSLQGHSLHGVDLKNNKFINSDLSRCNLCNSNLTNSDLSGANLNGTELTCATIDNVNFSRISVDALTKFNNMRIGKYEVTDPHNLDDPIFRRFVTGFFNEILMFRVIDTSKDIKKRKVEYIVAVGSIYKLLKDPFKHPMINYPPTIGFYNHKSQLFDETKQFENYIDKLLQKKKYIVYNDEGKIIKDGDIFEIENFINNNRILEVKENTFIQKDKMKVVDGKVIMI